MVKFGCDATEQGILDAFKLGEEAAAHVTEVTFGPYPEVELEMEKISCPYWIGNKKKRYIGKVRMYPGAKPKIDAKGIEIVRRDNSKYLRDTYKACIDKMMPMEGLPLSPEQVLHVIRQELSSALKQIKANEVPLEHFVISKSLKKYYSNPESMGQVVLANKIKERIEQGQMFREAYRPGDRIEYVIVEGKGKMCERCEDLEWVKTHKELKIDRMYYVGNQLVKPLTQLTEMFGPIDDLFEEALADLNRQRLGMASLKRYFTTTTTGKEGEDLSPPKQYGSGEMPPPKKKKKPSRASKKKKKKAVPPPSLMRFMQQPNI